MSVVLLILFFVSVILLVWVSSIRITPSGFSPFEIKRRASTDSHMKRVLSRDKKVPALQAALMLKRLLLLATTAWLAVLALGWLWGVLWTVLIIVLLGPVSRLGIVHRPSQRLFDRIEVWLLKQKAFIKIAPFLGRVADDQHRVFHSREELAHSIEQSGDILTANEKKLLSGALVFRDKRVKQVMTPKKTW